MTHIRRPSWPAGGLALPAAFALLSTALIPTAAIDTMGLALPGIRAHFAGRPHLDFLIQAIGSAAAFAFAASSPLTGRLIDAIGYRAVYILSLLLFTAIGVAGAFAPSIELLVLSRGLIGIAVAGALTSGLTGISRLGAADRPRMLGLHAVVGSLGAMALFTVVGHLAELGWRPPFAIHLLGLALLPFAWRLPRHDTAPAGPRDATGTGWALGGVGPGLLLTTALAGIVMFSLPMLGPFYLIGIGVTQASLASIPLSVMALSAVVAASAYGAVFRRFGLAGSFVFGLLLMGGGLLVAGMAATLPVFTIGTAMVGASLCVVCPNISAAAIAGSAARPGRALGVTSAVLHGIPVAMPFITNLSGSASRPGPVFVGFGTACILLAAGYAVRARRARPPAAFG